MNVNVDTNRGVVQLNGVVARERTRLRVNDVARQVEDVRQVVNNLKVKS